MTAFIAIALLVALGTFLLRRRMAAQGSGRLAQVAFRKQHGDEVARLLDGEVDPRPHSPWIAIQVDGRPARMVAAPVDGRMQAGIELFERSFEVQVWFTDGSADEVEVPHEVDRDEVMRVVAALREADVVSCANSTLRLAFDEVDELPARLARIAPLLRDLEAFGSGDVASGDDGVDERD